MANIVQCYKLHFVFFSLKIHHFLLSLIHMIQSMSKCIMHFSKQVTQIWWFHVLNIYTMCNNNHCLCISQCKSPGVPGQPWGFWQGSHNRHRERFFLHDFDIIINRNMPLKAGRLAGDSDSEMTRKVFCWNPLELPEGLESWTYFFILIGKDDSTSYDWNVICAPDAP